MNANATTPVVIEFVSCSGEPVVLEGTTHVVASSNAQGQFFRHENVRAEGVGASGTRYILTIADSEHENFHAHNDGLAATDAFHVNLIAVGEGVAPDDQISHGVFHVTANADGEITSSFGKLEIDCR